MADSGTLNGEILATKVTEARAGVRRVAVRKLVRGGYQALLTTRKNSGFGVVGSIAATPYQAIVDAFEALSEKAAAK